MKSKKILLVATTFATGMFILRGLVEGFTVQLAIGVIISTIVFCLFFFTIGVKWIEKLSRKLAEWLNH
ncbi:MAG: hypothetical protein M3Y60_05100 [Bacteroidota bacterium]|nr:hypothetical protein [Bacteroidota bacterium]